MPDKLKLQTPDLTAENIQKIAELFPGVVSDGKVNFDLLRTMLGDEVMGDEAYEFTWVGKREAIREAGRPIRKTLRPCVEESKNWDTTENLYIEGDNLEVLKLLQESYLGKVKMIYIDPPYNTGNDFIYRDNFTIDKDEYDEACGVYDEDGDKLFMNTKSNGRFHSEWCSMMYPRLVLGRNLLANDGVIFISCDNNEQHNLKKICDEVFGEDNFITNFAIENNPKGRKNNAFVSESYEYCLLYAKSARYIYDNLKNKGKFFNGLENNNDNRVILYDEIGEFRQSKRQVCGTNKSSQLASASKKERCFTIYFSKNLNNMKLLDEYDEKIDKYIISETGRSLIRKGYKRYVSMNSVYELPAIPLYTKDRLYKLFDDNLLYFKDDGSIYEKDRDITQQINSFIGNKKYSLDLMTESATANMESLLNAKGVFRNSKAIDFIKAIIFLYPQSDFICVDFFSGSATTAHAVMQLNAEDGGKRQFIMVQLPEVCASDSEAAKAGYKNICEIGKERIRRAGEKIKAELEAANRANAAGEAKAVPDVGFRVLKLDDSNMKDVYFSAGEYTQGDLQDMVSNIKVDRTDMDLLYGCLLDWGLPLSLPHTQEQIDGVTVHTYNDGDLIACFSPRVSEKVVKEIARRQPLRVLFRDSSFASSPDKINVEEIFKLFAPHTTVKVI